MRPSSSTAWPSKQASAATTARHRDVALMETLISSSSLLRREGRESAAVTLMAAHATVLRRTSETAVSSLMRPERLEIFGYMYSR